MPDTDTSQLGDRYQFRNPMDAESIRRRLAVRGSNPAYDLAWRAAGHQSAFTTDKLAQKIRAAVPELIADLAAEVEAENLRELRDERRQASA